MHFHHHVYFKNMVGLVISLLIKVPSDEKKTRSSEKECIFFCECENSTSGDANCEVGVL